MPSKPLNTMKSILATQVTKAQMKEIVKDIQSHIDDKNFKAQDNRLIILTIEPKPARKSKKK